MQRVRIGVVVALVLTILVGQVAWAVTPQQNGLPFDEAGNKVYTSGKNVWVPIIVFFILVALSVAFAIGVQRLAGFATRSAIAFGLLALACSAGGLAVLFQGVAQDPAEVAEGPDVSRVEFDGLSEAADGLGHLPLFLQGLAEVVVGLGVVRIEFEGLEVGGNGLG